MQTVSFRKPSELSITKFLLDQSKLNFTYSDVHATNSIPPSGYTVDHNRIQLGTGKEIFEKAKAALIRWEQFNLGWAVAFPNNTPIEIGQNVAVLAHILGFWWLNASRIVYVAADTNDTFRFGFAYGTLPGHAESGEERFLIEWNKADDTVWYDLLAFSKPNYLVAKLGYPFVRIMQKRFARDSKNAMLKAML